MVIETERCEQDGEIGGDGMVGTPEQEQGKTDVEDERNGEDALFVARREGVGVDEINMGQGKRGEEGDEG